MRSVERPGAFGKWAIQVCLEGHGSFCSSAQLARRHCRPGSSERARVSALLHEHSRQKHTSYSQLLTDSIPLLEGSSPSTAADVLLLLRLVGGEALLLLLLQQHLPALSPAMTHMCLAALGVAVNGRVSQSHIQMVAVLLAVGKHVRSLQAASRIVGRCETLHCCHSLVSAAPASTPAQSPTWHVCKV